MSETVIRVQGLSKQYRIGAPQPGDRTLRESAMDKLAVPPHRLRSFVQRLSSGGNGRSRDNREQFWALRNLSFEIKRGEVVGIIGHNGAGKSTLLKILSRITKPTEGYAQIRGRIGSLLEVGTGFHPELTGRENIYLSGAILGMRRSELDLKFDEIVDFSGVEQFIDTPVKRYSSGMQVRLGFAVAAHLEPDILLVDEVLAVGDAAFQRKCIGRMRDVATKGRTVVFVSHSMAAVQRLCNRAYLLDHGRIIREGDSKDVIETYVQSLKTSVKRDFDKTYNREGTGLLRFTGFRIRDSVGQMLDTVHSGQNVTFELYYEAEGTANLDRVVMSIGFFNLLGQPLFLCRSDLQGTEYEKLSSKGSVSCNITKLPLPPGEFRVNLQCKVNGEVADWIRDAEMINVVEGDFFGSGRLPPRMRGDLLVDHQWLEPVEARLG